jgi:HEAT repeat protein
LLAAAASRDVPRDSAEGLRLAEGFFEVRRSALVGLGYTRAQRAASFLGGRAGIGDGDFRLRAAAVRSLGVLGFPESFDRVKAALSDPSAEVRWTAGTVLGRLGWRGAVPGLLRRLADDHAEVRRQSALSLGYLGDRKAVGPLQSLARSDEREAVREAAAYAARLLTR